MEPGSTRMLPVYYLNTGNLAFKTVGAVQIDVDDEGIYFPRTFFVEKLLKSKEIIDKTLQSGWLQISYISTEPELSTSNFLKACLTTSVLFTFIGPLIALTNSS